ncbi:phytochelatin synthase [Nitzschia inconspicua]|uniref:glutathione gamma-glutamylcysteinyltransferase n=1 Tax=Nitzschia inconspicua TaxID=303405 RepID=A0A9K3LLM6_9STRA|nr:phytochelatin synthase [Nitzschia inconspicua]
MSTTSNLPTASETAPNKKRPMSFYKRKLPVETCVAFASKQGKRIFRSALENNGLKSFYNVIEQHHTQTEPAFCGISTLVMVLNALAVDPGQHWKGPWRWYEEKMLNCCVDLEEIKKTGITLKDFQCLAMCQGVSVDLQYSDETSRLEDFRRAVEAACVESESDGDDIEDGDSKNDLQILVVSYDRKVLKQTGSGHFSPVAAYDRASDSILILDTARFKYGAHWVKLPLIYEATKSIDPDTGTSRGFALLSFLQPEQQKDSTQEWVCLEASSSFTQPSSILFRSKMKGNEERRKYKEYLETISGPSGTPLDLIRSYWMSDGHPTKVWNIIEPIRARNEEEKEVIAKMRSLLADLKGDLGADLKNCCDSKNHKLCVTVNEALMIVCLASIPEPKRREIVMNVKSTADTIIREELLKEAALIASAIAISDEFESFEDKGFES